MQKDILIDKFLPHYTFSEYHEIVVDSPIENVYKVAELEQNKTKVSTETRVLCVATITKITFRLYWSIIKPFSGLTRKKMLKIIKQDSENKLVVNG